MKSHYKIVITLLFAISAQGLCAFDDSLAPPPEGESSETEREKHFRCRKELIGPPHPGLQKQASQAIASAQNTLRWTRVLLATWPHGLDAEEVDNIKTELDAAEKAIEAALKLKKKGDRDLSIGIDLGHNDDFAGGNIRLESAKEDYEKAIRIAKLAEKKAGKQALKILGRSSE